MKIWRKIVVIISLVALLACSVCAVCLGAVGGYDVDYGEYLAPYLVEITTHDDIVLANGTFGSTDYNEVSIYPYTIDFINDPTLTTLNVYSLDRVQSFENITLTYGALYTDVATGPFIATNITILSDVNVQDYLNCDVSIAWHDYGYDGQIDYYYNDFTYSSSVGNGVVTVPIRDLVTQYGYGTRCIDDLIINVYPSDGTIDTISFTSRPSGDYGIAMGQRVLENVSVNLVNPNVLDWLSTSVGSLMNTPIFGENVTLGSIMFVIMAVPLVLTFLKVFAGG